MEQHAGPRLTRGLILGGLAAVILRPIPLVGSFSYEYALVFGVGLFGAGLWLGVVDGRRLAGPATARWGSLGRSPGERLKLGCDRAAAVLVGALLGGIVVPALIETFVTGCRWERGLVLFLFVALPMPVQGYAIGLGAGVCRRPLRVGVVLVAGYGLLAVGLTAWEGLAGPRAVLHNLVVGVVSLTGYLGHDDVVPLDSTFWLGRLVTLALAGLGASLAVTRACRAFGSDDPACSRNCPGTTARRARRVSLALLAFLVLAALWHDRFGLGSGRAELERTLTGRLDTPHFVIRYRPGSVVARHLGSVAEDHEWALARLSSVLELEPGDERVTSYVYASDAELERVTGARGFLFTKPWLGEMHTRYGLAWGRSEVSSVRHELAHIVAARFGLPGLRVSLRYGLIEGFAEAAADGYGEWPELHAPVAAAQRRGLVPDAASLVTLLGFAQRSARGAYSAAGSFCGWLLMTRGPKLLCEVYAQGDFERVYGQSLEGLNGEWKAYLEGLPSSAAETRIGVRMFAAPPFYRSSCPRLGSRRVRPEPGGSLEPLCRAPEGAGDCGRLRVADCLIESERAEEAVELLSELVAVAGPDRVLRLGAMARLGREAARRGDREEAAWWLAERWTQGGVGSVSLGLETAAVAEPRLYELLGGEGPQAELGPVSSPEQALVTLWSRLRQGMSWCDPLDELSDWVGGCGPKTADAEAWVLLGAARAAHQSGQDDRALALLDNAQAVAVDAGVRRGLAEERRRIEWAYFN